MGYISGGNSSINNHTIYQQYYYSNHGDEYIFYTITHCNNMNIRVPLRIFMRMMERVMVMWVVDMAYNAVTLSQNVNNQVPLRILMWMLEKVW